MPATRGPAGRRSILQPSSVLRKCQVRSKAVKLTVATASRSDESESYRRSKGCDISREQRKGSIDMRLTLTTFVTLDGVMQAPGGPDEDPSGGFEHGGWLVPYADADMGQAVAGWFAEADAFLLGRRTYEIFAAAWPKVTDPDDPIASRLNALPKYVASRTLQDLSWNRSELIGGDVATAVAELKRRPGRELQVHGSGGLAQTLLEHGLVDEYRLLTYPVVLGKGKRLFGAGAKPTALGLVDRRTTSAGVAIDVYAGAGEPMLGSFELTPERSEA